MSFVHSFIPLTVAGTSLNIAAIHRGGARAPIVFLHGFGSTKEDYADIVLHPAFDGHAFVAYDAPGCGESQCAELAHINIPLLLDTALQVLEHFQIDRFHLVGHSMGGLTALMLAHRFPGRVLSNTARAILALCSCFSASISCDWELASRLSVCWY